MSKMDPHPWFSDSVRLPDCYDKLLAEIEPHLSIGQVVMRGKVLDERRATCMYVNSPEVAGYTYTGRTVTPFLAQEPEVVRLFELVNNPQFGAEVISREPRLDGILPVFNALFVNWYRPPVLTNGKVDYISPHSDKLNHHTSEVILSITFCEPHGERLFRFFDEEGKVVEEYEFATGAMLWMLPGCQQNYKHCIAPRKTNLQREVISGGRLNLTFRAFETK
jgi:alkylated DNA repair dioxygenase AlkB